MSMDKPCMYENLAGVDVRLDQLAESVNKLANRVSILEKQSYLVALIAKLLGEQKEDQDV
jgi:hypothetical protein